MGKTIESLFGAAFLLAGLLLFLGGMVLRWSGSSAGGDWIEEVTIYFVVWGMLLSAASGVALDEHVRADFVLRLIGPALHHWADILAALAGLVFCVLMAWLGWQVVQFSVQWDERGPSMLQIPTSYYYAALPTSLALCSLRYLMKLAGLLIWPETGE